jgi:hypothetical protein
MYKPPHQKSKNTFITPLRIENAQSASSSSLITAPEGGVLNERRCKTKVAALDDTSAFPDLIAQPKASETNKPVLDFKAKLETAQIVEVKKPPPVMKKQKRCATPDEIMSALNDLYLRWKEEYIEEYGEEYYERYYRFPDYDFEFFDKLDEKLERDLELEEMKERQKEIEDDYVTESYEEYEKE